MRKRASSPISAVKLLNLFSHVQACEWPKVVIQILEATQGADFGSRVIYIALQTEIIDPGASPRPNIEKAKSLAASVMAAIVGTGAVTLRLTGMVRAPFEISPGVRVRKAL